MRLGIDFGTTRVVVAAADRGNYPVVTFDAGGGESREWFPSLCAQRDGEFLFGHAALAVVSDPDWTICRSLKRLLSTAGPHDQALGIPVTQLAARFLAALVAALRAHSNLRLVPDEPLEVAIAVPASANANQRLLTGDAFTAAGFQVLRMLDEPSAAGLEYAWRRPDDARVKHRHVAVYDLGGGTFDASVIAMSDTLHEVITTAGAMRLGGDDFDEVLLGQCLAQLERPAPATRAEHDRLLEICRQEKERFTTSTRRLRPDMMWAGREPNIPVAEYEAALSPLIQKSLDVLADALDRSGEIIGREIAKNTVIYQVGGASQLPTVARVLREQYGRRVWRSPYPHASVAIGLAIAAEDAERSRILGRFTRFFGVWREGAAGQAAVFDPLFAKDTPLPESPASPLVRTRRYRAAHNIGHFRFVECSRLTVDGTPSGDVAPWREVRFPLVRELVGKALERIEVARLASPGEEVEEQYRCTANGVIEVEIANLTSGYQSRFQLHGME